MKLLFKMFFVFTFISNVAIAYGNTSFNFSPSLTSIHTQKTNNDHQVRDNKNDSLPLSLLILVEEEETETNEEFLHAAIFIAAFFQPFFYDTFQNNQPNGDYSTFGKKIKTQNIFTFIETFRI